MQSNHGQVLSCPCGYSLHRERCLGAVSDEDTVFSMFTGNQVIPNTGNKTIWSICITSPSSFTKFTSNTFQFRSRGKIIGGALPLTPLEVLALIWYEKEPWQLLVILPKNLELPKGASVFYSDFQTFLTAK